MCIIVQDVLEAVRGLGLDPAVEYSALEYSVDLALPEHRIAIEVGLRASVRSPQRFS